MNWGTKIMIVLSAFVALIGSMVYVCMKQKDIQLVTKDYYEQEIVYQQVIDKENNYRALLKKPLILDDTENNRILIDFSQVENHEKISGTIHFFRPSQSKLDFKTMITTDKDGFVSIEKTGINKGKWLIKLDWNDGKKEFYNEQTIFIQ